MNKKIYIIANWKMQLTNAEAADLAEILKNERTKKQKNENVELILCPSFTALAQIGEILQQDSSADNYRPRNDILLKLGAQDIFYHAKGAYTGEISPAQLKELGVTYVIVGHSERRQNQNETDEEINQKIKICLENNLTPILCVGEKFEERQAGRTDLIIIRQITKALQDIKLTDEQKIIIAYEPVWVIGSGQAVAPAEALHAAEVIQRLLPEFFSSAEIKNIKIIYGGSVDETNVNDFIVPGVLDGVLVGGASLIKEKFVPLIEEMSNKI
jgi:triosephosphate isomerase